MDFFIASEANQTNRRKLSRFCKMDSLCKPGVRGPAKGKRIERTGWLRSCRNETRLQGDGFNDETVQRMLPRNVSTAGRWSG
jgi:hypothetical protein